MCSGQRYLFPAVGGLVLVLGTARLPAQDQPLPQYTGSGKVDKTAPNFIQMTDAAEQPCLIRINPQTRVTVVGTAEPSFLTSGLFVRFTAELNNKGLAQGEISDLAIIEPSDLVRPGIQADLAPGEDPEKKGPISYLVVGQVRSFKNGQLQVSTPGKKVKARLAEAATITVDVTNYGWAREGDEISVDGKLFAPGRVIGEKVDITLAKPLAGKSKKKSGGRPKKNGGKPDEPDKPPPGDKPAEQPANP